ncbi:uncharacterized protein LOC124266416, partial [Haliotis rubra]
MASDSSSDCEEFSLNQENVQPYSFEPTRANFPDFKVKTRYDQVHDVEPSEDLLSSNIVSSSAESDSSRPPWCTCGHCVHMQSEVEELCCQDVAPIREKLDTSNHNCITSHPGLHDVSLSKYSMEAYYNEFIDSSGPIGDDEPIHKIYRHLAYRRFTYWIWQKL